MWQVKGKRIDAQRFEPFEPLRVLNFCDGPKIFTFHDADEALCLACWSDEDETSSRFLVVPVSEKIIAGLDSGERTVRDVLDQPRLWVVDLDFGGAISEAWLVSPKDVPDDAQPQPGTMLHRESEPQLSMRAI